MNPVPWLQMTNMISYQGLVRTFLKAKEGSKNISKAINLLPEEIEQLQQLVGKGVEVEIRQVPNDRKQLFAECV